MPGAQASSTRHQGGAGSRASELATKNAVAVPLYPIAVFLNRRGQGIMKRSAADITGSEGVKDDSDRDHDSRGSDVSNSDGSDVSVSDGSDVSDAYPRKRRCVSLRAEAWLNKYVRVLRHLTTHDSLPQFGPLRSWINYQKGRKYKGLMSADRAAALEAIPGWQWGEPVGSQEVWHRNYKNLVQYYAGRARNTVRLRDWMKYQRARHWAGELSYQRTALLEALPRWRWHFPHSLSAAARAFVGAPCDDGVDSNPRPARQTTLPQVMRY